jgi:hypothetical protein
MALRYYPSFRIKTNQSTAGGDFTIDGKPYVGKYYVTFDGKAFSGPDPVSGPNQQLTKVQSYESAPALTTKALPQVLINDLVSKTPSIKLSQKNERVEMQGGASKKITGAPTQYYPYPLPEDYERGYIIRYFTKKKNEAGYVVEISEQEYNNIKDGIAGYDIAMYQIGKIMWKLTGPLNSVRLSQFDTRAGIIDTNRRLTENLNKTFLGITDFIGGDYTKWARPTT